MKVFLHPETHVSVRLRTAFGRSKVNIGGVGPVTKLQATKSEESFDFRQRQNIFPFYKESRAVLESIQTRTQLVKRLFPQSDSEIFYCRTLERMEL
jgi:hypothetical protein